MDLRPVFRHLVNLELLFSFLRLAATGVLSFIEPLSLRTTRLHTLFKLLTVILAGLHRQADSATSARC